MSETRAMWLTFFRNAGIPTGFDTKYAVIFDENRIRQDMLMDITKECLRDMGITAMGDIIAILKHAKKVYDESKEEALETVKPTSTTALKVPVETASKSAASSTTMKTPSGNRNPTSTKSATTTKTVVNKAAGSAVSVKSSITAAKASNTKPAATSRITSSTNATVKVSPTVRLNTLKRSSDQEEMEMMKKKIIVLKTHGHSDGSSLKEEVPVQKKVRVLPEHEGKYNIKMPDGTTARTQKLLQNRLGPSIPEPNLEKKLTVFERLGESKVSSSCESKIQPATKTKILSPSEDMTQDTCSRKNSSVFARLGSKSSNDPTVPRLSMDKSVISTKFEVRQTVSAAAPSRFSTARDEHGDKSLTSISSRGTTTRDVKGDVIRRPPANSNLQSGMRSDAISNSGSVKHRLGMNASRQRSRSRSPPAKKRFDDSTSSQRSRSPIYIRDDARNSRRPSSVVTAPPPRRTNVASKVSSSTTVKRETGRWSDERSMFKRDEYSRSSITTESRKVATTKPKAATQMTSKISLQDSLLLPDIEDPLAGYYSDSN